MSNEENAATQQESGETGAEANASAVEENSEDQGELLTLLEDARSKADEHWDQCRRLQAEIENLRSNSAEIAGNSQTLSQASQQTASGMEKLTEALSGVEQRATDAAELSAGVVESSQQGRDQVQRTVESMKQIDASTRRLERVIEQLGERASKIGVILGVIDNLAEGKTEVEVGGRKRHCAASRCV